MQSLNLFLVKVTSQTLRFRLHFLGTSRLSLPLYIHSPLNLGLFPL